MNPVARRRFESLWYAVGCVLFAGCLSPWLKGEKSTAVNKPASGGLQTLLTEKIPRPERVGQVARPAGLTFSRVEAVGLVSNLMGTGGSPEPGRQRDDLIREIRTHEVPDVNLLVDSPNTAMVIVDATVPPGIQGGERLDLTIRPSRRTVASSLHGGWLMPARLREMRFLGGDVKTSDVLGTGVGPVVTRWDIEGGDDPQKRLEGVIVGGGKIMKNRALALTLRKQSTATLQDRVELASSIADAINERFFYFDGVRQRGVASAKSDEFIDIAVHPAYRRNIRRYMTVIDRTPLDFAGPKRTEKMKELAIQILDPATATEAALTLEALGRDDSRSVLRTGLSSSNELVQFVSAESLSYLEDREAIPVLTKFAKENAQMRHNALRALGVHPAREAGDALESLLHEPSNETRFGALRELMERKDANAHLAMRKLRGDVDLILIPSTAPPLVTVATSHRAAVAIFGAPIPAAPNNGCAIGEGMSARVDESGRLRLTWFRPGQEDKMLLAPATMEGFVEGLCEMEVPYGCLVAAIRRFKEDGHLNARLAFDPLPKSEADRLQAEAEKKAMDAAAQASDESDETDKDSSEASLTALDAKPWWDARSWFAR